MKKSYNFTFSDKIYQDYQIKKLKIKKNPVNYGF